MSQRPIESRSACSSVPPIVLGRDQDLQVDYVPRPGFDPSSRRAPELAIIVPTFNERPNVRNFVREVEAVLGDGPWEVIFVDDDSPDETAEAVRELSRDDCRIRCVQRIGRRGLSTACVEGMLASSAPYLAVMDGDLQHDPTILPKMLGLLKDREANIEMVVGSRYVAGGGCGEWSQSRIAISKFASRLGSGIVPGTLQDPMSGFFMLRRSLLDKVVRQLSGLGFKILVDIFASAKYPVRFEEVSYVFRTRQQGESKLDSQVAWEFLMLLADKTFGRYVPIRFLVFALVGCLGVGVHFSVLAVCFHFEDISFITAQATATLLSIVFNYALNNSLTYRDKRRRGFGWFVGLISFMLACGIGALANVGVAHYLFQHDSTWWLSAVAGILTGAVWNYAVTSIYTWGKETK